MDKKMKFKYFYGAEADQFSFYRIPKALFTDSYFKDLSSVWEWCKNVWNWNSSADTIRSGMFENDVKMYGTETQIRQLQYPLVFENDVKMYGTKTDK